MKKQDVAAHQWISEQDSTIKITTYKKTFHFFESDYFYF